MPAFNPVSRGILASATCTTSQTGISTATDITGLSITFTVGSRPVIVRATLPAYQPSDTTTGVNWVLTDASNTVTSSSLGSSTAATYSSVSVEERFTTPGTYTRKVRAARQGTGTISTVVGTTLPAVVEALER